MKMAPKVKKKAPATPKAKAKAAMLKGIHSHKKKEDTHVTHLQEA